MLLTEGADPLLKNKKGITPLEHSKGRKKLKCERILRSYAEGKMKPRRKISKKQKTAMKHAMKPVTDEDLAPPAPAEEPAQEKPLPTPMTYSEPTYTEVIDLTVEPTGEVPEGAVGAEVKEGAAEGEEQTEEVVVADETKVVVTEASPEATKEAGDQTDFDVTEVVAPFEPTAEEKVYQKLDIGDIGDKPEPLDMEELAEEPSQTLLPLRRKKQAPSHFSNTPRLTPRMKMFTPMKGGTPADLSRAASGMSIASVASDRTVAYRNVDHKGDKLYSKAEITKQYKGDYQTMVLELTALKAENMQLVKEGEVLTNEIQRLNIQWKTVRHENETVKYTVKEVMKENEDLKESMSTMTTKMNKMNVDIDRLLADNTRLSKENKKLNQDLMKELHFYKAKHLEEKQRAESLAISLQEQKRIAIDLEEQLSLPPEKRTKIREDCKYKDMVLDFIASLNIPESFKVPKFTKCFCKECCPDVHLEYRGQPLMMYAVPQNYVRFGVATDPRIIEHNAVFDKHHVSFYPIHPATIRDMIASGVLLPGSTTPDGERIPVTPFSEGKFSIVPDDPKPYKNPHSKHFRAEFRHPEKCMCGACQDFLPTNFFFTSPTIKYIEHPNYRPYWVKYQGKMVRCAFQVRQKQDAYNILWRTTDKIMCSSKLLDPFFRNDELEYFSADARNFVITGLCVSITDLPKAAPAAPLPAAEPAAKEEEEEEE